MTDPQPNLGPEPRTVLAIADWIEYRSGRVRGLSQFTRSLLAELLRDGSWKDDTRERSGARERAAEAREHVAWTVGRHLTREEVSAVVQVRGEQARRRKVREDREARALASITQQIEEARRGR
jgi:hypothetical protein